MAKSVREVMGGIFCCMNKYQEKPWCNDCPYEQVRDCRNVLQNDISTLASAGKLELGSDGNWQPAGFKASPKIKEKRKTGRRIFNEERRNNRQYEADF